MSPQRFKRWLPIAVRSLKGYSQAEMKELVSLLGPREIKALLVRPKKPALHTAIRTNRRRNVRTKATLRG